MPGILPMKVIKVGANAQTRIAQACDRCRSKKIRCDGIRPCCSQCDNVGFECKTSDKLSRRAFPRGYTESLEERVRGFETEVRELKDLLDEKDEKIDMLSRIHSQSSQPIQLPSPRRPSTSSLGARSAISNSPEKDEILRVQQSPCLLDSPGPYSYFAGTSSSRAFIEAFKRKAQESGRSTCEFDTEVLLDVGCQTARESLPARTEFTVFKAPPRLVSDQLINIFFQEWAPLFPVLHRPTFLSLYEKYVARPTSITDKMDLAQLNLVFAIAATSSASQASRDLDSFEAQWTAAVQQILGETSIAMLQVLVLAQIFCMQQGDLTRLLMYKGLSTSLSARLGLHQPQKRFALGTLTCETRKKVFWTLYTIDCFTAVMLGLPRHIRDDDAQCEYPVDADDEYITEAGFQPALPGESTKLSSALALFRIARILAKVLEDVYPARASYELSLRHLSDLQDELDMWSSSLAPHLRLQFANDKPSTGTITSRSPLLSLAYHFVRALINRPVVCTSTGNQHSSAMIAHASSCKHMVQIVQLLAERGMCFAFCWNKQELLVTCGVGLMMQGLSLDHASMIRKDGSKMIKAVARLLNQSNASCVREFTRMARECNSDSIGRELSVSSRDTSSLTPLCPGSDSVITINPHPSLPPSTRNQLKAIASRFSSTGKAIDGGALTDQRRATVHNITSRAQKEDSAESASRSEPSQSPGTIQLCPPSTSAKGSATAKDKSRSHTSGKVRNLNLDYLSFGSDNEGRPSGAYAKKSVKPEPQPTDWERLLGSLDNGETNIYDACYGGQPVEALLDSPALRVSIATVAASESSWNTTSELWAQLCQSESNPSVHSAFTVSSSGPDGTLSFSPVDDLAAGRSSSEDSATGVDWVNADNTTKLPNFRGMVLPAASDGPEDMGFSNWDTSLIL